MRKVKKLEAPKRECFILSSECAGLYGDDYELISVHETEAGAEKALKTVVKSGRYHRADLDISRAPLEK